MLRQVYKYSKTSVKRPLSKRAEIGFQDQLSLSEGHKILQNAPLEHSAILSTFIKLPLSLRSLFCLFLSCRVTQVLPRAFLEIHEKKKYLLFTCTHASIFVMTLNKSVHLHGSLILIISANSAEGSDELASLRSLDIDMFALAS